LESGNFLLPAGPAHVIYQILPAALLSPSISTIFKDCVMTSSPSNSISDPLSFSLSHLLSLYSVLKPHTLYDFISALSYPPKTIQKTKIGK